MLRGEFIALKSYIREQKMLKVNDLNIQLKKKMYLQYNNKGKRIN